MVSSQHKHFVRVANLVGKQQTNSLDAVVAAVNVVSHYYPLIVWRRSAHLIHYPQHIEELPVKISCNDQRSFDFDKTSIHLLKCRFRFLNQPLYVLFRQVHLLLFLLLFRQFQLQNHYFQEKLSFNL